MAPSTMLEFTTRSLVLVSVHLARAVAVYLRDRGAAPDAFPRDVRLIREMQWSLTGMIDVAMFSEAVNLAYRLSAQPDMALQLGAALSPQCIPLLGHLLLQCPTLRVALANMQRYMPLLFSRGTWSLLERDGRAHAVFSSHLDEPAAVLFAAEFAFAWGASLGRQFVGQSSAPIRACFPYPPPAHADAYGRVLRCPVYFECPDAELVFDAATLDLPQPCHDRHMYRVLRDQAERELEARNADKPWHHRVLETLVDDELALVDDWSQLATKLGLTARTLRRNVAKEGYTLFELRDEARKQCAFRLLTETDDPVKQISERVGFSELSPFYRAFRRWTGGTPKSYRSEQRERIGPQSAAQIDPGARGGACADEL